jgi:hypothetical protein
MIMEDEREGIGGMLGKRNLLPSIPPIASRSSSIIIQG